MKAEPMLLFLAASSLANPQANAAEALGVVDLGDEAVVVVSGVTTDARTVEAKGDLIELPIAEVPQMPYALTVRDRTIRRVELIGGETPRIRIKTRLGPRGTAGLAARVRVELAAPGLRIHLPRLESKAPEGEASQPVPAPESSPRPAPRPAKEASTETSKDTSKVASKDTSNVASSAEEAPASPPPEVPAPPPAAPLFPRSEALASRSDTPLGPWLVGLLAIGASLALALAARRRRATIEAESGIQIVSSCSLGPKTRLAVLRVRDRELLLSMSDTGARLIADLTPRASSSSQTAGSAPPEPSRSAPPERQAHLDPEMELWQGSKPNPLTHPSPAVRGLLVLKHRPAIPPKNPSWHQELQASLGGEIEA
ncbi:MAG: FliO/MopB family protein [Deltaproteobacteria bacterium]|nr:FliO/MopB family protein [Deltaproteobacteria bacterium]